MLDTGADIRAVDPVDAKQLIGHAGNRRRAVDLKVGNSIGALVPSLKHQAAVVHAVVVMKMREECVGDVDSAMPALDQAVMRARSVIPDDEVRADFEEVARALPLHRRCRRSRPKQCDRQRLGGRRRCAGGGRSWPIEIGDAAEDAARAAMSLCLTPAPRQRDDTVWGRGFQADSRRTSDQPFAQRLGDRFRLRVHLQLVVDVLQVEGDGVDADAQLLSRSLPVMPVGQQLQQLALLRRQAIGGVVGRPELAGRAGRRGARPRVTWGRRRRRPRAALQAAAPAACSSTGSRRRPRTARERPWYRCRAR